jgi:superfamily II DNA/RNA helicase
MGSGKTVASMLAILSNRDARGSVAIQIQTKTVKFTDRSDLRSGCVFGGASMGEQS